MSRNRSRATTLVTGLAVLNSIHLESVLDQLLSEESHWLLLEPLINISSANHQVSKPWAPVTVRQRLHCNVNQSPYRGLHCVSGLPRSPGRHVPIQ